MRLFKIVLILVLLAAATLLPIACGGGGGSPSSPDDGGGGGGSTPTPTIGTIPIATCQPSGICGYFYVERIESLYFATDMNLAAGVKVDGVAVTTAGVTVNTPANGDIPLICSSGSSYTTAVSWAYVPGGIYTVQFTTAIGTASASATAVGGTTVSPDGRDVNWTTDGNWDTLIIHLEGFTKYWRYTDVVPPINIPATVYSEPGTYIMQVDCNKIGVYSSGTTDIQSQTLERTLWTIYMATYTPTRTGTPTPSSTPTPSYTPGSPTDTPTPTISPTQTHTPTISPTPSSTSTPTTTPTGCPVTLFPASPYTSAGTGTWYATGGTISYTNISDWTAAASTDATGVNIGPNEGGVITLADDPGYTNLGPVTLRVTYRANNTVMRLLVDYNVSDSATVGILNIGPATFTPPDTNWNTYIYTVPEAEPWTGTKATQTRVFLGAISTGGGGSRSIDIDSVELLYEPCQ